MKRIKLIMKKIKELYKRYEEWEEEEVYFDLGITYIQTNRATVLVSMLVILGLLQLML